MRGRLRIAIYDVEGRLARALVDVELGAGVQQVGFATGERVERPLAAGILFYRIEAAEGVLKGRFVVTR